MSNPIPGAPVRGSETGRPIMAAFDLLGRRGAMRIIWELRMGPLNFRALQQAADTNPAVLNTRIKELRSARLLDHDGGGYHLTGLCIDLLNLMMPLNDWAERWARELSVSRPD
ncbi:transcriptional regulator [Cupriavidus basilensis]|uniref:Transcriptional regulator n=1 Tax=Cupriavidus basilensis TaxID=68895 RepID=A0ABT6B414_9BURK|nr:helix-turn-helix domain-containing protein [Cupriavidus basilensis]MDF3839620.1 transcriptional regulator [Cupriavidus basilensis]